MYLPPPPLARSGSGTSTALRFAVSINALSNNIAVSLRPSTLSGCSVFLSQSPTRLGAPAADGGAVPAPVPPPGVAPLPGIILPGWLLPRPALPAPAPLRAFAPDRPLVFGPAAVPRAPCRLAASSLPFNQNHTAPTNNTTLSKYQKRLLKRIESIVGHNIVTLD